jgi:hypothetical protein
LFEIGRVAGLLRPRSRGRRWVKPPVVNHVSLVFAAFVLLCAISLSAGSFLSLGFLFERNYNEGWNVYNAQRLLNHEVVYDSNYWRINNYPIGSFLMVSGVNFFVHNLLICGRIVALLSFAAIGVLAAMATRRFGGDRIDAIFGSGCTLGFCYLAAPAWIMVDDPQTLGEAVMLAGLASYLARSPNLLKLLFTALLVVSAGFIKHNLVAIPLAVAFDLAVRSPRRLLFWLLCCSGFAVGCLGLTQIVAGGTFIDHLLSPRIFAWYGVGYHLKKYLRLFKFPLVAILLLSPMGFSERRRLLAAWGIFSIASAALLSGFEGTSYNMFQDAAVFLGIAAGVTFSELRRHFSVEGIIRGRFAAIASPVATLMLAQPIFARAPDAFRQIYHASALLNFDRQAQAAFMRDVEYIAERQPAICESMLLCYNAGQPFILDPFNSRQYILAGKLDQDELIRRIAAHEFGVIQLRADICDDPAAAACHILHYRQKFNRFTDDTLYAVDRYYKIGRRSQDGTFYVPK